MPETQEPYAPTAEDYGKALDTLDMLMGMVEAESFASLKPCRPARHLPLVIVSGFLGAGKTTLMRRLLTADHGLKITAVVNDVANLNIDAALISEVAEDTLALANGCVCCSQSGGAARALIEIAAREDPADLVLLEASGVADPWALAQVAASVSGVRLEAVVTVVDASAAVDASIEHLLRRQIAAADLVLLNKIDLVSFQEAESAAAQLARLAPRAQVLRTIECAVPHGVVLDTPHRLQTPKAASDGLTVDDSRFRTIVLAADAPVDRQAMAECLTNMPAGILRAKGFLRLTDAPDRVELLQAVGRRWRWDAISGNVSDPMHLVVIGLADATNEAALASHFAPVGFDVVRST